jgi:hypothetical protein
LLTYNGVENKGKICRPLVINELRRPALPFQTGSRVGLVGQFPSVGQTNPCGRVLAGTPRGRGRTS